MSKSTVLQDPAASRQQLRDQIRQTVRDAQVAAEDAAREGARARAQEGVVVVPRPSQAPTVTVTGVPNFPNIAIPPEAASISIAFFIMIAAIVIGLPIMRAIARRIERGAPVAAPISAEVRNQLQQISQSVDAIAIEVERISEGQRYTTRILTERTREGTVITPGASTQG